MSIHDTTREVERALHGTDDAAMWARAFKHLFPSSDEALMLGWFANAIETGKKFGLTAHRASMAEALKEPTRDEASAVPERFSGDIYSVRMMRVLSAFASARRRKHGVGE